MFSVGPHEPSHSAFPGSGDKQSNSSCLLGRWNCAQNSAIILWMTNIRHPKPPDQNWDAQPQFDTIRTTKTSSSVKDCWNQLLWRFAPMAPWKGPLSSNSSSNINHPFKKACTRARSQGPCHAWIYQDIHFLYGHGSKLRYCIHKATTLVISRIRIT
jgi:hypothetical protein